MKRLSLSYVVQSTGGVEFLCTTDVSRCTASKCVVGPLVLSETGSTVKQFQNGTPSFLNQRVETGREANNNRDQPVVENFDFKLLALLHVVVHLTNSGSIFGWRHKQVKSSLVLKRTTAPHR